MTKHEIGEAIGFYIFMGLLCWALVSFFPLTWGQALIISWISNWMYNKFVDELK